MKPFAMAQGKKLKFFVCGPTVYDFSHLGHARTYIAFDMIVKYLRQQGYKVFYLQNITDIDDKIIVRAAEKKITPSALAKEFEKEYLKDMKALGVKSITKYARATGYIKEIISQVERLLKKGFAYHADDGIYYDISKFKNYGKLSKRTTEGAESAVSRIDESKDKKNKGDFCLWKFTPSTNSGQAKPGEPQWKSPWGQGRPGWHIEDTAITEKFFGPQYDVHGGARDLIFPHHEAEISQMEAISGKKPLVKYWMHTGFLTIEGQKMSKSLGNFITINDFLTKYSPRILRALVLKSHYLSPIDYNAKAVEQTKKELEKIDEFIGKLKVINPTANNKIKNLKLIKEIERKFNAAMVDDFNTPKAMAAIFDLINKGNALITEKNLSKNNANEILNFLKNIDKFFNFIFRQKTAEKIPDELLSLASQREQFRKEKNWQKADEIRNEIQNKGFVVEDTAQGPKIKKI